MGRKWAESGQKKQPIIPQPEPIQIKQPESNELDEEDLQRIELSVTKREKGKSEKLYPLMVEAYNEFCLQKTNMGAKMNAHQGKALKSIVQYLASQIKNKRVQITEEELKTEVLSAWNYVLGNWHEITGYYAEQIKLSQIDSNLPNLLVQLRNKKTTARNEKFASRQSQIGSVNFE